MYQYFRQPLRLAENTTDLTLNDSSHNDNYVKSVEYFPNNDAPVPYNQNPNIQYFPPPLHEQACSLLEVGRGGSLN